jgi:hypothetical protein
VSCAAIPRSLKYPKQHNLRLYRDFADLIKKDSAGVGQLKAATALLYRAGEGSFLVAKEF